MALTRKEIGYRLAQARKATRLSQTLVAEYLSINRESVSGMENGRRPVNLPTLHRLADLYDVSLSWMLSEEALSDETTPDLVKHLASRARDLSAKDWETVSGMKRIAMNLNDLNQMLADEGPSMTSKSPNISADFATQT